MRKTAREGRKNQERELKRIEAEARKVSRELHRKDHVRLQEEIRCLTAQRAVVLKDRFVVWSFDRGPAGRPVAACDTVAAVVREARAQLGRQSKNVAPAIQLPGGLFWPGWMKCEANPERYAAVAAELERWIAAPASKIDESAGAGTTLAIARALLAIG